MRSRNRSTTKQEHEARYPKLKLFGQTLIVKNPGIYHPCVKRKKEPLAGDAKRKKIAASTTNQDQILSTALTLFDETWIAKNLHLYRPYVARKEPVVVEDTTSKNICVSRTNQDEILSTELNLFDQSWITKNLHLYRPWIPRKKDGLALVAERGKIASSLSRMRFQGDQNYSSGVSTHLKLYEDPWKIKKKLEASDVGHMTRLLVGTEVVRNHILRCFTAEQVTEIHSNGLNVTVCDLDTSNGGNNSYTLKLKYWRSSKSYVFLGGWSRDFVKRRGLRQGDEIGLYWDSYYRRFYFSVL